MAIEVEAACGRCGHAYDELADDAGDWNLVLRDGEIVALLCPSCQPLPLLKRTWMLKSNRRLPPARTVSMASSRALSKSHARGICCCRIDAAQMITMTAAFINEMGAPGARPPIAPASQPAAPASPGT
jgi:hypothetical protein